LKRIFLFWLLCICQNLYSQVALSGFVFDRATNERLPGAHIRIPNSSIGTITNDIGYFSLKVRRNDGDSIYISAIGFETFKLPIPRQDTVHQIGLNTQENQLKTVVVRSSLIDQAMYSADMGRLSIDMETINNTPTLLAEKDVFKTLQMLPGVSAGKEGSSGLFVRGGSPDQNLILLDGVPMYNAFHLLGFYSTFNADAVGSVNLIKGSFPARFGGRLSSVVDVQLKEGSPSGYHGAVSLGLLSSKATVHGPAAKNTTFIVSGRRSYVDLLIRPIAPKGEAPILHFADFAGKLSHRLNDKHTVSFGSYLGQDAFGTQYRVGDTRSQNKVEWKNYSANLKTFSTWRSDFRTIAQIYASNYQLTVSNKLWENNDFYEQRFNSGIQDVGTRLEGVYLLNSKLDLTAGLEAIYHRFRPNAFQSKNLPLDSALLGETIYTGLEHAQYLSLDYRHGERLFLQLGLRNALFHTGNRSYGGLEPRANVAYRTGAGTVKASFARTNQFIHQMSTTGINFPADLWVPATNEVPAQRSWQLATGYAQGFRKGTILVESEVFYKKSNNIQGYQEGSSFLVFENGENPDEVAETSWEENLTTGHGESYGWELLLRKPEGRLNGWFGYTLSWVRNQFDLLNNGDWFYPMQDQRHNLNIFLSYKWKKNRILSASWVYASGQPFTAPLYGIRLYQFHFDDRGPLITPNHYSNRNAFRMVPTHRLDLGIQFLKEKKRGTRIWDLSIYNAYNRINPYFILSGIEDYGTPSARHTLYYIGLFPMLPSVAYRFEF
jgi:hypothetical protein